MTVERLIRRKGTTCTIQRRTAGKDGVGGRTSTWSDLATNVPVFVSHDKGRDGRVQGREGVTGTDLFFFLSGTDITENDRVILDEQLYDVKFVTNPHKFNHHIEVDVEKRI